MDVPVNPFKRALLAGAQQIGLWCTLASAFGVEVVAGAGFDWLLLDTEHSPADVPTVLAQLQALAAYKVAPVVRPASNDTVLIKRYLDIGAQSLLIPYVQNAAEARQAVAAVRYPPEGVRGVSALTRATQFGRVRDYGRRAHEEICLLVQVETVEALREIPAIADIDGVDGIFIGPGDLAASMGLIGQLDHPDVTRAVEEAIRAVRACGKPCGILTANAAFARRCIELGTRFTAVGVDVGILARGAEGLVQAFK
jgi:4-hydroxy-2-oxoheptanedioate aldolase